jgi:nucleoside-triphosphatase
MPELILLTGGRGAGKTTLCRQLVDLARRGGWRIAGLISPPVFENGVKIGIEVEDLSSGERRRLARLPQKCDSANVLRTGGWVFEGQGMNWGGEVLGEVKECDLLLVDELGPLELLRGEGWQTGLAALDGRAYRLALAVIRLELLAAAQQRWPGAEVVQVEDGVQAAAIAERLGIGFLDNPPSMDL